MAKGQWKRRRTVSIIEAPMRGNDDARAISIHFIQWAAKKRQPRAMLLINLYGQ
jgi:hypothetical protein